MLKASTSSIITRLLKNPAVCILFLVCDEFQAADRRPDRYWHCDKRRTVFHPGCLLGQLLHDL